MEWELHGNFIETERTVELESLIEFVTFSIHIFLQFSKAGVEWQRIPFEMDVF